MGLLGKNKKQNKPVFQEPVISNKAYKGGPVKDGKWQWAYMGLALSVFCALVLQCFYGVFRTNAEKSLSSPIENGDNISWLYQNCYLLYRDLYNAQYKEQLSYKALYLEIEEEKRWILEEERLREYQNYLREQEEREETLDGGERAQAGEGAEAVGGTDGAETGRTADLTYSDCESMLNELGHLDEYFQKMDEHFRSLNSNYDYIIQDNITGKYITNMSSSDRNRKIDEQYFLLSFHFDSVGNVTIGDTICGMDESQIRKYANEVIRNDTMEGLTVKFREFGRLKTPVDCTVTFAISRDAWTKRGLGDDFGKWGGVFRGKWL